ncbi:MAG: CoA pyrophosphatase [Bacteroidales bacterium]|nr:CoA pyrophosphatase [Bacteroidales bacterium]
MLSHHINQFELFISSLEVKLRGILPGEEAHLKMIPENRRSLIRPLYDAGKVRQSAVLILLFQEDGKTKTVFIKRNTYEGVHSGQISFPGGRFEESDSSLLATALREAEEEVNIPSSEVCVIGMLSPLFIQASNFEVLPVVGYLTKVPTLIPDPTEVESVFTCEVEVFFQPNAKQTIEIELINKTKIKAPCFMVSDFCIWGATSMILSELIELINN